MSELLVTIAPSINYVVATHSRNQDNKNSKDKIRNLKNDNVILTTATTATLTSCKN